MNSADMRDKAMEQLAEATSAVMAGRMQPEDWMAALDDVAALAASAKKAEAEEVAQLLGKWEAIKVAAEAALKRADRARRDLWKNFLAGVVVGAGVVYMLMNSGVIG